MALKDFTCPCGRSFEALDQFTVNCPQCGAENARPLFTPCANFKMPYDFDRAPEAEIDLALRNKAYIEKNADKVKSGEITVKQGKEPSWLRPNI